MDKIKLKEEVSKQELLDAIEEGIGADWWYNKEEGYEYKVEVFDKDTTLRAILRVISKDWKENE